MPTGYHNLMTHPEIPLPGGQITPVVRIGDTVRRGPEGNRALQHALLLHLEASGFTGSPHFRGSDEQGRDILTFLPGHVPLGEGRFTDSQLAAAARLLRAFHDATVDFPPVRAAGAEVMCHNDWTPANAVMTDGRPTGLIDFDTALPGTRLWDVAYSVWTWLDLGDPDWDPAEQRRRLALFIAAYDHPSVTPTLIAATLPARQAGRAHWAAKRGMTAAVDWANASLAWTLDHVTHVYNPDGLP